MNRIVIASLTALVLASTLAACSSKSGTSASTSPGSGGAGSGSSPSASTGSRTLTLGAIIDVASFDPSKSDVGNLMQYLQPAYDTLIKIDDKNQLVPMLATKWVYTDTSNTDLQLTLRSDVKFSDGTAMTADSVVKSLQRFKDANGPRSSALANVKAITAPAATIVDVKLSTPDPALLHNFGLVAGMITNPNSAPAALNTEPAGAGPYKLDSANSNRGNEYKFVRNTYYYDNASFPFDQINIRVLIDNTARLNAVKTGEVDAAFAPPSQLSEAKSSGLNTLSNPGDWQGLYLNDREGTIVKALGDVRVRQAINYAIDGDSVLKVGAFGQGTPSTQIFYPGTPAYDPSLNAMYPYDPAKAKELLAAAGYPNGFSMTMPGPFLPSVAPLIQQQLAAVGIQVQYKTEPASAGLTPYLSGEFPAYFFSWGSSDNWLDASLLLSKQGAWNPLHASDPKIESFLQQIPAASGPQQDALYKQLSAYVVNQAWFVPFYVVNNVYIFDKSVSVVAQPEQSVPSIYNFKPAS